LKRRDIIFGFGGDSGDVLAMGKMIVLIQPVGDDDDKPQRDCG